MSGHSKGHNIKSPKRTATRVWKKYRFNLAQFWHNEINKIPQSGVFYRVYSEKGNQLWRIDWLPFFSPVVQILSKEKWNRVVIVRGSILEAQLRVVWKLIEIQAQIWHNINNFMFTKNTSGICVFVQAKFVKTKNSWNTSEICTNYWQNSWQKCYTDDNQNTLNWNLTKNQINVVFKRFMELYQKS